MSYELDKGIREEYLVRYIEANTMDLIDAQMQAAKDKRLGRLAALEPQVILDREEKVEIVPSGGGYQNWWMGEVINW